MSRVVELTKRLDSLIHFCQLNNPLRTQEDLVALFGNFDTLVPDKLVLDGTLKSIL